jgi:hypothetical protein
MLTAIDQVLSVNKFGMKVKGQIIMRDTLQWKKLVS